MFTNVYPFSCSERLEMAEEVVKKNAREIRMQMSKMAQNFYEMHSNEKTEPMEIIDNTEWHSRVYLSFFIYFIHISLRCLKYQL